MKSARLLRYARRRAGMTQRELALAAGMPQPSIAKLEAGRSTPRLDTLERLLNACGFSLELEIRAGAGVDRSLLLEALKLSPAQRARRGAAEANNLAELGV